MLRLLPSPWRPMVLLLAAPAARAADVVGIADQSAEMFAHPAFQDLEVRVSRLIVRGTR